MKRMVATIAAAALLGQAALAIAQDDDGPSLKSVLEAARAKYWHFVDPGKDGPATAPEDQSPDSTGQAQAPAGEAERPALARFSPLVLSFTPGLSFPCGYRDTSIAAGLVGSLVHDVSGLEGASVFTIARDVRGGAVTGIFNISRKVRGFEGAGIFNLAGGDIAGVQAGLINIADDVEGVQLGLVNIAGNGVGALGLGSRARIIGLNLDVDLSAETPLGALPLNQARVSKARAGKEWGKFWDSLQSYPLMRITAGLPIGKRLQIVGGVKADIDLDALGSRVPEGLESGDPWSGGLFGEGSG